MPKPRILIVEDETIIAMELAARLEKFGYEISGITDTGEEAVEIARESAPDIILMDVILKGRIDGVEAVRRMRKEKLSIPVVYITAYSDKKTFSRASKTSPYAFLLKPFEEYTLRDTVQKALDMR